MAAPLPDTFRTAFARAPKAQGGARASAVLLHGYTGSPYELVVVAEALAAAGIASTAPLLPGHGTQASELNRVHRDDWRRAAAAAFDALPDDRPRLLIGGSMGGLLAAELCAERAHQVTAAALLAPAFTLKPTGRVGAGLAQLGLSDYVDAAPKAETGGDCGDEEGRAHNPCYTELPLKGLVEFDRLRAESARRLRDVHAPVLVVQGGQDRTVEPSASRLVVERVRSPVVERHLFPASRHVLGLDVDRDDIAKLCVAFFARALA